LMKHCGRSRIHGEGLSFPPFTFFLPHFSIPFHCPHLPPHSSSTFRFPIPSTHSLGTPLTTILSYTTTGNQSIVPEFVLSCASPSASYSAFVVKVYLCKQQSIINDILPRYLIQCWGLTQRSMNSFAYIGISCQIRYI